MGNKVIKIPRRLFFIAFGLLFYLIFLMYFMNRSYPKVGSDYRYFLPRMVDTYIHFQKNDFSVQWFTPSFGGGLPAYPNPQNLQFTINQVLLFLFDPWLANLITISVYVIVGYVACYRLGRDILKLSWMASLLGSLFFIATGFFSQHNLVGHVGYQAFPLIALFSYITFSRRWKKWQRGILLGLIVAIFIFSAGFYSLVILGLTLIILIPLVYLLNPDWFDLKNLIIVSGVGGLTASLLSIGKIYAVMRFMNNFPRIIHDHYYYNFFESFSAFFLQLTGVSFLSIPFQLFKNDPDAIAILMKSMIAGGRYGIWEMDVSISPVLFIVLISSLLRLPKKISKITQKQDFKQRVRSDRVLAVIMLLCGIWIAFDFTTARGVFFDFVKDFPFFESLHVNIRFASSFILPIATFGAYLVDKQIAITPYKKKFSVFIFFYLGSLLWLGVYFFIPNLLEVHYFNLQETIENYRNVKGRDNNYVAELMDIQDYEVFSNNSSSLYPYEPIFGYGLEDFSTKLVAGSIYSIDKGYYNFNNPKSFVYGPDAPFTRFSIKQKDIMEQFVHYQQPDWEIPTKQLMYNTISAVTFFGIVGYGVFLLTKNIYGWLVLKRHRTWPFIAELRQDSYMDK